MFVISTFIDDAHMLNEDVKIAPVNIG